MKSNAVLLVNLSLVAAVVACLWQFRANQNRAERRQRAFTAAAIPATEAVASPFAPTPGAQPVQYAEIALRSLFTPDRHPHIVVDPPSAPAPPPPVPAFPRAHGVLDLGSGPMALLSLNSERQRAYQPGETLGPWRLKAIAGERLAFEWVEQGRVFEKTLDELRARHTDVAHSEQEAVPVPDVKPRREELTGDGPGPPTGASHRVCKTGDRTPVGTVVDGFRKVESPTPFGNVCRWELVPGGRG